LSYFVRQVNSDGRLPFEKQTDLPPEVYGAVIASQGRLTPKFSYILDLRRRHEATCASPRSAHIYC
jgi:hypothetical protein